MIHFSFNVMRDSYHMIVRHYKEKTSFGDFEPDIGSGLAWKINSAIDCILRCLEDDEESKQKLLRIVRDHVIGRIRV